MAQQRNHVWEPCLGIEKGPLKACLKGWNQMMMCPSGKGAALNKPCQANRSRVVKLH